MQNFFFVFADLLIQRLFGGLCGRGDSESNALDRSKITSARKKSDSTSMHYHLRQNSGFVTPDVFFENGRDRLSNTTGIVEYFKVIKRYVEATGGKLRIDVEFSDGTYYGFSV